MDKRLVFSVLPLILLAAVLAGVGSLQAVHAAGYPNGPGTVCLDDASALATNPAPGPGNPCPLTPYKFVAPFPSTPQLAPTQIRVGVYINGSAGLNGLDVTVLANHATLAPVGVDLTGTVLIGTPVVVVECVGGRLVAGSVCAGTDTPDTIHLAATSALGSSNTVAPTSGLLFTAIYNVTAATVAGSPLAMGFQTGCTGTSVTGGVCVTIANGSNVPNAETVQGGSFDNSVKPAWVAITSSANTVQAVKGGASPTVTITATAENGFPGTGCGGFGCGIDNIVFSSIVSTGFTGPSFSVGSCVTGGISCSVTATFNTGIAGSYSATIFGTYVGDSGTPVTLVGPVTVTANIQDVGFTINGVAFGTAQTAYVAKTGGSPLFFVTAQSIGAYTGTISYTVTLGSQGTTGLTAASYIIPVAFTLAAGATVTKAINVTAAVNEGVAVIKINQVTSPTVGLHASGLLSIKVSGFTLTANPTSVNFNPGGSGSVSLASGSLGNPVSTNGFAGNVAISTTVTGPSPAALGVTCTSFLSVTVAAAGTGTCSITSTASTPSGAYSVVVTGTGGTNSIMTNSTTVSVTINPVGPPPGIDLSASPTSVTVNAGTAATSTITVVARGTFTGTVNLSTTLTGGPGTLSCTLTLTSVAVPPTKTSALSCNGSAGTFTVTVNAVSGSITNSTSVSVIVQDFTVVASPTSVPVNSAVAGTSTITVAPLNGFASAVALAVTTNSTNLVCNLSSTSIASGSGTSTLSCTGSPAGNYLATVTGTSGALSHSAMVVYHVAPAPDFIVAASPTSVTVNVGVASPSTITVSPVNGFTGTVTLAVTPNSTSLVCSLSATSISGGSGSSTLSCHGSPAGNYLATVTSTSGTLSHSATVTYHVQDFTVAASPTSVSPNVGVAGTSTITVAALNGFSGTVTLAVTTNSTNLVCALSSTSITGGSGMSTLSCTGSPSGNYLATITGTSGTLSHSATVTYHVTNAADFTVTASPASVIANAGVTASSTITVAPLNGFTGTVTLAVTTNSTNLVCSLSSTSITGGSGTSNLSCHGSPAGNYLATVTGTSGILSHSATVTFHTQDFSVAASPISVSTSVGVAGTSSITVAPINGFGSTVAVTVILAVTTNSTNLSCTLSSTSIAGGSGSSTLSCSGSVAGNYLATVTGTSGTLSHSASVVYHVTSVPDFSITASPISVNDNTGVAGTSTIAVAPVNGFAGTITLAVTTNSTNLSCTLSSTSVAGGSGTSMLSCTAGIAGNYLATVTGTSGTLSHFATVTYHVTTAAVPDFTVSANPASLNVNAGSAGSSTITVSPLNGFTATVTLAVTTNSTNLVCTLNSTSIAGGSGASTLSCHGSPAANYLATVTGTSGTLSHSATVTFHAQDFTVSANPASVNVNTSIAGTSTISVARVNGFTGTVALAATTNSTNLSCTLSSTSITGGSGSSTLSCSASVAGNYLATVTGTSGTLTHSTSVVYHVTTVAQPDFAIAANPTTVTVTQGTAGTSTITVTPVNGFTGTVALAVTSNSASLSCTLSSTSITGGSGMSSLSCSSSTAGTFTATVTGTTGSLSHSVAVTFNVIAPSDFTISASPASVSFTVGSSAAVTINVASLNGLTGTVSLTTSVSPSGLTATCSPTTISLGASGASTCTLSSSTAGSYTVKVTGTSGTLSHSATISATVTQITTAHATQTNVTCSPGSVTVNVATTCMAKVIDTTSNPTTPTGTITFTTNSTGGFGPSAACTLAPRDGTSQSSCSVSYTPTIAGRHMITGSYSGDSGHAASSGSFVLNIRAVSGGAMLLTFNGFNLDDFDNGLGQLQVFVNGQFVVDIPAGLNVLSGTGDFNAYADTNVIFGPFDIARFLVDGQNTILFKDPTSLDHLGSVSNVTIVQGSTVLLHVSREREVSPESSPHFTFSNPPLTITGFTVMTSPNQAAASTSQNMALVFTANFTGGTGPFTCIFSFGDGEHAAATGSNGTCSATHDYDSDGTFTARVVVRGASTSDVVSAHMTITVSADPGLTLTVASLPTNDDE